MDNSFFVVIHYEEGEGTYYETCVLPPEGFSTEYFRSGDPVRDFNEAIRFCRSNNHLGNIITFSSTVDFFPVDNPKYEITEDFEMRRSFV